MVVVIDNYDSFTFNLVHYFHELGVEVKTFAHDKISIEELSAINPSHIVISPGPGTPDESGISLKVIDTFAEKIPILGVCLGHQALAQVFGAKVIKARKPMHGKTSLIHHKGDGLFKRLAQPFIATRYHSLVIQPESLPSNFEITAWTVDKSGNLAEVMAISHSSNKLLGVQFHPEAILTEQGHDLLGNYLSL